MEQLKAFIEKAESDKELMDKLGALGEKNAGADDVVVLAAEYGFTVTAEEVDEARANSELSEEQLEEVAGGVEDDSAQSYYCWFYASGDPEYRHGANRKRCRQLVCKWAFGKSKTKCACYGTDKCIDSWHYSGGC